MPKIAYNNNTMSNPILIEDVGRGRHGITLHLSLFIGKVS